MKYNQIILTNLLEVCKKELTDLGFYEINDNTYTFEIHPRYRSTYAEISRIKTSSTNFLIKFNKLFLDSCDETAIKNTIIHELIHSIKNCMNHGAKWQSIVNKVNKFYGYNIQRCQNYKEYDIIYEQNKYKVSDKYVIYCNNCDLQARYKRKTKLIDFLLYQKSNGFNYMYRCPCCNNGWLGADYIKNNKI